MGVFGGILKEGKPETSWFPLGFEPVSAPPPSTRIAPSLLGTLETMRAAGSHFGWNIRCTRMIFMRFMRFRFMILWWVTSCSGLIFLYGFFVMQGKSWRYHGFMSFNKALVLANCHAYDAGWLLKSNFASTKTKHLLNCSFKAHTSQYFFCKDRTDLRTSGFRWDMEWPEFGWVNLATFSNHTYRGIS